jgi:excisionase family DNA binding protein
VPMSDLGQVLLRTLDAGDLAELRRKLGLDSEPQTPASGAQALMSAAAAAERCGCSVETVRRAARSGALRAVKIGRRWRFDPVALTTWLESVESGAQLKTQSRHGPKRSGRIMRDAFRRTDDPTSSS